MFRLGIITDEVSQDLEVAAEFAVRHGISALEIRSVNGKGPFEMTAEDIAAIRATSDRYGLQITAISAPLFKCSIRDQQAVAEHIAGFERLAGFCQTLGCKLIRGFDFWEEGASLEERAAAYQPILRICEQHGVTCVLEYDPSVHSCTAEKVKMLVEAVNSPYLKALYDPGNGLWADGNDIPYPNDYDLLKDHIAHIHIKDAVIRDGKAEAVCVGTGLVDYQGLFARLMQDDYSGYCMLETHYRKEITLTDEQLKRPGGTAFSAGAYEASEESMASMLSIIEKIKGE